MVGVAMIQGWFSSSARASLCWLPKGRQEIRLKLRFDGSERVPMTRCSSLVVVALLVGYTVDALSASRHVVGEFVVYVDNGASGAPLLRVMRGVTGGVSGQGETEVVSGQPNGTAFLSVRLSNVTASVVEGNTRVVSQTVGATVNQTITSVVTLHGGVQEAGGLRGLMIQGELQGREPLEDYSYNMSLTYDPNAGNNTLSAEVFVRPTRGPRVEALAKGEVIEGAGSRGNAAVGEERKFVSAPEIVLRWQSEEGASYFGLGEQYTVLDMAGR